MGKTLGVLVLAILLTCCSSTTDNHNISMVFFKDGQKNVTQLAPNEQLIEESVQNKETVYKDKLERWQQTKKDRIILEKEDGSYLYRDGKTGNYFWKSKDRDGNDVIENLYDMQNRVGSRFWYETSKTKISDCDFGVIDYNKSGLSGLTYELPRDYHFKLLNGKIPELPESEKKLYRVDDPFFITFDTLEQGWRKFQKISKNRSLTYGREIEKEFLSSKYKVDFAYLRYDNSSDIYRYDNINPEPNSYWVDRKVGSLRTIKYEPKPCKEVPILRSDHFREDVKKYVETTLKPVWFRDKGENEKWATPRTITEAARITMIPMSPKIWMILVSSQNGNQDPTLDGIWTFSIVEFDNNKPILRSWGQQTFTNTWTWGMYGNEKNDDNWADPEQDLQLYGYCDVNLDGYKDFVLRFSGFGSGTYPSNSILILSYTDKGIHEIVPSHPFFDFCGMDGSKPLFTYLHYGSGQLYQSFKNECQESTRWNLYILKVVEPRKDGNLYMVSYKYHTNLEELEQDIKSKHIDYLGLGNYEIIGKARAAQKAFLETATYTSKDQLEIVKILLEKNHSMFVDRHEDLLPELEKFDPK